MRDGAIGGFDNGDWNYWEKKNPGGLPGENQPLFLPHMSQNICVIAIFWKAYHN